jgi:Domain of unknown function (DUF6285)
VITHPTAAELLRAVMVWLEGDGAAGGIYMARVARNALGIVLREMEFSAQADRDAVARLQSLLGLQGDLATLEAALRARLRDGSMKPDTPGLLEHLRLQTLDRLAIDQPRYRHELRGAACRRAVDRRD